MNRIKSPAMNCKRKTLKQNTSLLLQLAVGVFYFSIVLSGCEESEVPEKLVDEIDEVQMREEVLTDFKILFGDVGYQDKGRFIVFESNDKESAITMYYEICSTSEYAEISAGST